MKVTLRVVGIQFNEVVTVNIANPKIEDVMKAARDIPDRKFNFIAAPDNTLHLASAILPVDSKSKSSGEPFAAGYYELTDGVVANNTITTWQWYLIRDEKQVNQPDGKVDRFVTQSPEIKEGDTIIWRLVVVATAPKIPLKTKNYDQKAEKAKSAI